jgi:flagellar basal-body rod protein FlgF
MDRLGYTAMTAASRTMMSLQVRSNNLANVNTPGFRADLERARAVSVEGYGYDSRHLALVENNGVNLAGGPMIATGRTLDFAVKGPGLIVLQDGEGEAFTRQGSMQIDSEGRLTLNGRAVLGEGGPIELPPHDRVEIGNDGTVSIMAPGDYLMAEVDRIRLVDVPAADLTKNQAGLLVMRNGEPAQPSENVRLASGFLESSNVSAIDELASTMSLSRLFETQVKMMKAAEDLSDAGNRMIRGS